MLQVDQLAKSYGDRLLFSDVTFGIERGQKVGLIAPNGSGKSTLLSPMSETYAELTSPSSPTFPRRGLY